MMVTENVLHLKTQVLHIFDHLGTEITRFGGILSNNEVFRSVPETAHFDESNSEL